MLKSNNESLGRKAATIVVVVGVAAGLGACGTTASHLTSDARQAGAATNTANAPAWAKDVANSKDVAAAYAALTSEQKTEFTKYMEVTSNKLVERETKTTASSGVRTTTFGSYVQFYNGLGQEAYRVLLDGHATSYESSGQIANVFLDSAKVEVQSPWYKQASIDKKAKKSGPTVGTVVGTFRIAAGIDGDAKTSQQCLRGMITSSKAKVGVHYTQSCGL